MNKLLVAVFDNEAAADAGLNALRGLHTAGDITLYAAGVVARDAGGAIHVEKPLEASPVGAATGLAVGSLIGLLGGPVGLVVGAVAGTVVGAVRDYWTAGVGLDFVEEASRHLLPGKVALVAEIEEEWVLPVDTALAAAGGLVFRRHRSDVAQAQYDRDVEAFKSEIETLEDEASHAAGEAKTSLQAKLVAARLGLQGAVERAHGRVDALRRETDARVDSLKLQLSEARGEAKTRIEHRIDRVKSAYSARGAKLSQAWNLTKEALTS